MTVGLTYAELKALKPCAESQKRVAKLLGGATVWNGRVVTADEARKAGCTFDDLAWAASSIARSNPDVERRLRLWLADCAACVLHIYEKTGGSLAPRAAIVASRQFARGEITDAARAAAGAAAWAAAWAADGTAAGAAAWAAGWAAAGAAAWDAARDAARAAAGDADGTADGTAARAAEETWQFDRLIARLSDDEPEDWPLPPQNKNGV